MVASIPQPGSARNTWITREKSGKIGIRSKNLNWLCGYG
jgi:hypothetical protein